MGATPSAPLSGLEKLPGNANYFIGNDPARWHTHIPTYAGVKYVGIYPGVDLVFHGNQRQIEYDFVVAPGTDPAAMRVSFEGLDGLEVNEAGDLVLTLGERRILQRRPCVYEETENGRRELGAAYVRLGQDQVAFRVEGRDPSRRLVIDPVIDYSTFLGGSGADQGLGIAVDASGNAYLTGSTSSTNFPLANPLQAANGGGLDAFVTKLDAAGNALVYSTYLGGFGVDEGTAIAVDSLGSAYLTGLTTSTNFPTHNPFQAASGGSEDAFVTKLDPTGSALVYSTYLGGTGPEQGTGIAVDRLGSAYVTGLTASTNFPTMNPIQAANAGGFDAYVAKFSAAGSALVYSTYLGGSGTDNAFAIAVDRGRDAYVTGSTDSTNFPTVRPFQAANGGGVDAFVTRLNAAGTRLLYSTYLGGAGDDEGHGIAVDATRRAYVTGRTTSTNFPTRNPLQATFTGSVDAFVSKLEANGSALVYSTYLGGVQFSVTTNIPIVAGNGIAVDGAGNAYVAGNLVAAASGGLIVAIQDGFALKIDPAGTALVYTLPLGGSGPSLGSPAATQANGIAVDPTGNAYVIGSTAATSFPIVNPFQAANGGDTDAFVTKISP